MNLIYTTAFDLPGKRAWRTMSKLLCSSLLRGFWDGQIAVFKNFPEPLFPVERKGLTEVWIETSRENSQIEAPQARFQAVEWIKQPEQYEWITYLDADSLALRYVEHLFAGDADILVQPETGQSMRKEKRFNGYLDASGESATATDRPNNGWLGREGINAGIFSIRGEKFTEMMAAWKQINESEPTGDTEFRTQAAFNKLLMETTLRVKPFERGEIMFPFHLDKGFLDYKEAALLHFSGGEPKDKIALAFALHMMRAYGDESGMFLDVLES